MRCISPYSNYSIQVEEGEETVVMHANGHASTFISKKPHVANFETTGLTDWEIEAALESFNFSGLPEGVNPLTRISVFDSEAYVQRFPEKDRAEIQAALDARLRELQKQHPSEFVVVEKPPTARPWGSYDTDSVEDILSFVDRLEILPEHVRLYEIEHQNRPEVVEALEERERELASRGAVIEVGA